MKKDCRFSSVLHVLLHMAHTPRPLTSGELAGYLHSHPVAVRRTLAGLRELGYVTSVKGHGGGWSLACDLRDLSLRDVYEAVGAPPLFALGHRLEAPQCQVEQAVNQVLDQAFDEARSLLISRLESITLAELSAEFDRRHAAHRRSLPPCTLMPLPPTTTPS